MNLALDGAQGPIQGAGYLGVGQPLWCAVRAVPEPSRGATGNEVPVVLATCSGGAEQRWS